MLYMHNFLQRRPRNRCPPKSNRPIVVRLNMLSSEKPSIVYWSSGGVSLYASVVCVRYESIMGAYVNNAVINPDSILSTIYLLC